MKRTGSMTILEHIAMAMEDLENEKILDTPDNPEAATLAMEKTKLAIEKAKAVTNLATTYIEAVKTEQNEKRLMIDAMDVAGKWNYNKKELKEILKIEDK